MSESKNTEAKTDIVVERLKVGRPKTVLQGAMKRLAAAVFAIIALAMWITPSCYAEEGEQQTATEGGMLTSSITDTENLLGSNVTEVTDAITQLHEETGVSVRLLYLASFSADEDEVDQWANVVLESTDPSPNTVLLAVASHDGSLVVAVSGNSDDWLRSQDTVDELSQSALSPLLDNDTPDWSGSALAMIDHIATLQRTRTTASASIIGVAVLGGVAAVLIIVVAVVILGQRRKRRERADQEDPSDSESEDAKPSDGEEPSEGTDEGLAEDLAEESSENATQEIADDESGDGNQE